MTAPASVPPAPGELPPLARLLGLSGLLPQIFAVAALLIGGLDWRFTALALAYAYAALILSFLGGLWWGLGARAPAGAPAWLWIAAVTPSLIALVSAIPWSIGARWPGPSLVLIGGSLIAALVVDLRLVARGIAPAGWLALRVPLSLGLGTLTLIAAAL